MATPAPVPWASQAIVPDNPGAGAMGNAEMVFGAGMALGRRSFEPGDGLSRSLAAGLAPPQHQTGQIARFEVPLPACLSIPREGFIRVPAQPPPGMQGQAKAKLGPGMAGVSGFAEEFGCLGVVLGHPIALLVADPLGVGDLPRIGALLRGVGRAQVGDRLVEFIGNGAGGGDEQKRKSKCQYSCLSGHGSCFRFKERPGQG